MIIPSFIHGLIAIIGTHIAGAPLYVVCAVGIICYNLALIHTQENNK
jgi:hypothetical protein